MFKKFCAERACKCAVSSGDILSKKKMEDLTLSISNLSNPWNCPHGRPTLSEIGELSRLK
jgi:DNA mismatch repair protein PMS2